MDCMICVLIGGEGGIRTRARCYTSNPLAGGPLEPLGYFSNRTELSLSNFFLVVNVFKNYFLKFNYTQCNALRLSNKFNSKFHRYGKLIKYKLAILILYKIFLSLIL